MGRTVLAMSRRTNAVGNGFMATRGFTTPATTGHRLRTSLIISLAADSKKVHITVTIAMTKTKITDNDVMDTIFEFKDMVIRGTT